MLDLQPGVHFDEVELAVLIQVFDRPDRAISEKFDRICRALTDLGAQLFGQRGRRGFLDHLLVTALHRTIALAEVDDVAVGVGEDLDFDVARVVEVLLDVDHGVAKGGLGLTGCGGQRALQLLIRTRDLHPASAAARSGLDQHRVSDVTGQLARLVDVGDRAVGTGNHRQAGFNRCLLGGDLVPHQPEVLWAGADEDQVVGFDHLGEFLVLGQKADTGVDGVGAGEFRHRHDGTLVEVGILRRRRADANRFVGEAGVHGVRVGGRMDRDGRNPHLARSPDQAQRDLTPVCNDDFVDLCHQSETTYANSIRGWPNSTGSPSATSTRRTMPDCVLGRWFMTFIASMIIRVSPSLISSPTLTKLPAPGSGAR